MNISSPSTKLFGTAHCHLCEQAAAILQQAGVDAEKIDVVEDDTAYAKYSLSIPVLLRLDNGAELNWPFDVARVQEFMRGL